MYRIVEFGTAPNPFSRAVLAGRIPRFSLWRISKLILSPGDRMYFSDVWSY